MTTNKPIVTFIKVQTGLFHVIVDGVKSAKYYIQNGNLGESGYGPNHYGICIDDTRVVWCGSLASAKKCVTFWITKSSAEVR